jgi:epoxyqueuosine reductase QueG
MNLTEKVRDFIGGMDADFVGIAPVERFEKAPPGKRPQDLLPEARSVVVVGIAIVQGVMRAKEIAFQGLRHAIYPYMIYGYVHLNNHLAAIAHHLSRLLEKEGHLTLPIPPSPPSDSYETIGVFSGRHAAVAAGLGQFGWNSLLVTPQVGSRLRLVSIITAAELEPDPMYMGEPICEVEKCRHLCLRRCPTGAISWEGVKLSIGGRDFEYARIDKWKCRLALGGVAKGALGLTQLPVPEQVTPAVYLDLMKQEDIWQRMELAPIGRASYCGRCLEVCPVGK